MLRGARRLSVGRRATLPTALSASCWQAPRRPAVQSLARSDERDFSLYNIERTTVQQGILRRSVKFLSTVPLSAGLIAGLGATPAFSSTTSGWVPGYVLNNTAYCNEATTSSGPVVDGYTESSYLGECSDDDPLPAGDLGLTIFEYFKGNVCGDAQEYADVKTAFFGLGGEICGNPGTGSYNAISFGGTKYGGNYVTGDATAPAANYNAVPATTGSDGWTTGPGGVSMGTIPPAAFTGGAISMASVPQYISVISQGTVVGYVASTTVLPSQGTPVSAATLEPPVYDASLSQVVGHLVSGEGFVPVAGSTLPATDSNGNSTSVTVLQAPPPQN